MDIYHTGREDKEDDHKFVNERLLEVAIPEPEEGRIVTLEDCLETYFNNRIEVKRYLQRQNTIATIRSTRDEFTGKDSEKNESIHIETAEMDTPMTPIVSSPISLEPTTPLAPVRPELEGRRRADSIFGKRYLRQPPEAQTFDEKKHVEDMLDNSSGGRPRSASLLKKEILMPAWQFFSLIRKSNFAANICGANNFGSMVHGQRTKVGCAGCSAFLCKTPCSRNMSEAIHYEPKWHPKAPRYIYRHST